MAAHIAREKNPKDKEDKPTDPNRLADPKTQREIMDPDGVEVNIFGDKCKLHPLAARYALRFQGFAGKVLGSFAEGHGQNYAIRLGSALVGDHLDEFLPFVARAIQPADQKIEDSHVASIVEDIKSKIDLVSAFYTFSAVFSAMSEQNKVMEALGLRSVSNSKN